MSDIKPVSQNTRISVDPQGLFRVKGRLVDVIGLIFQVQNDTKQFAQDRLAATAKELWNTNEKSKKLISILNKIRAARPTGAADSTVNGDKILQISKDYFKANGIEPFGEFGLRLLAKAKYDSMITRTGKTSSTSEYDARRKSNYDSFYANVGPHQYSSQGTGGNRKITILKFNNLKQAEVDQLIEGVKSQISSISSKQELINNDTQRYTRLSDETKEAMSNIEKSLSNFFMSEENKI